MALFSKMLQYREPRRKANAFANKDHCMEIAVFTAGKIKYRVSDRSAHSETVHFCLGTTRESKLSKR